MLPPSEAEAHLSRDPILAALLSAGGPLGGPIKAVHILRRSPESLRVSRSPRLQPDDLVARSSLGLTVHTQGRCSAEPGSLARCWA